MTIWKQVALRSMRFALLGAALVLYMWAASHSIASNQSTVPVAAAIVIVPLVESEPFSGPAPFQDVPAPDGEEVDDDDTSPRELGAFRHAGWYSSTEGLPFSFAFDRTSRSKDVTTPPPRG